MKQNAGPHSKSSLTIGKALGLLQYFDAQAPRSGVCQHWQEKQTYRKQPRTDCWQVWKPLTLLSVILKKKYCLGFKLVDIGYRVLERLRIREIALPFMEQLRDKVQETVHHTAEVDGEGIYVEKIESFSSVRLSARIGARGPIHAGASFKVLLAYLPEM